MGDEPTKAVQELANSAQELAEALEKSDMYLRSQVILDNTNNWMLAVSSGTLLLFLTNLDKFNIANITNTNKYQLPNKLLLLFALGILSMSIVFLAMSKFLIINRQWIMSYAVDSFTSLTEYILRLCDDDTYTPDQVGDYAEKGVRNLIDEWIEGHNKIILSEPMIKTGITLYIIGSILLALYSFLFFYEYT